MSNDKDIKEILKDEIPEGYVCKYCGVVVSSNEEYLKHLVDEHWAEFVKDYFDLEV